jgi:hypothetical protein
MNWVIRIDAGAEDASGYLRANDGRLSMFSRVLEEIHGGSATGDRQHWSARIPVRRDDLVHTAEHAVIYAERLALDAAVRQVGLPEWPITRTEVLTELLGTSDATRLLGISRQRLHELRQSGRFPAPAADFGSTPVWLRSALDGFAARRSRQPGPRPRQAVAYIADDGAKHSFTATADEQTGVVWVPVSLAATEPALSWILDLDLPASPRDGMNGPAVFRVPRWKWASWIDDDGRARPGSFPGRR